MRTPSPDLYQLIQSLTKEEKKKITIHLKGLGQKGTKHIRLFNAIYKQKEYNEQVLKSSFKANTFSTSKRRLYELIIDVLLLIERQESIQQRLRKGLQVFDILCKKGLYEKARTHIYELEELAEKHESFSFLPFISTNIDYIENRKLAYTKYNDESFNLYLKKRKSNQVRQSNLHDYMLIQSELRYITVKYGSNWLDKVENIQQNPLLTDINNAKSCSTKFLFHAFNASCSLFKKEHESATFHTLESLAVFEKHLCEIRPVKDYIACLFNVMYSLFRINKSTDLDVFFVKIEENIQHLKKSNLVWKQTLIIFKAKYYVIRGDVENGNRLTNLYGNWLFEQMDELHLFSFFSFGTLYFFNKKYEKSRICLDPILDKKYQGNKQVIYWAKLFQIVIFFEEAEFRLMESLSRSLYRKLQEAKEDYQVELVIINALKKLALVNRSEMQNVFKNLHRNLSTLKTNFEPKTQVLLEYFNYIAWAESKLKNKTMAAILAENITNLNNTNKE